MARNLAQLDHPSLLTEEQSSRIREGAKSTTRSPELMFDDRTLAKFVLAAGPTTINPPPNAFRSELMVLTTKPFQANTIQLFMHECIRFVLTKRIVAKIKLKSTYF